MELFLNLAGTFVAAVLICLWLLSARSSSTSGANRRTQLIALALLILVIFPVISVTDDLLAAENPAETDSFLRRDHEFSCLHAAIPQVFCPGEALLPTQPRVTWSRIASLALRRSAPAEPALAPIENRPPPTA